MAHDFVIERQSLVQFRKVFRIFDRESAEAEKSVCLFFDRVGKFSFSDVGKISRFLSAAAGDDLVYFPLDLSDSVFICNRCEEQ